MLNVVGFLLDRTKKTITPFELIMTESELIFLLVGIFAGLVAGIGLTLAYHKIRSGSVSPASAKRELAAYQNQVEEHFNATSDKFRAMASQYQDLYQHLSLGATELCRAERLSRALTDVDDTLTSLPKSMNQAKPIEVGEKEVNTNKPSGDNQIKGAAEPDESSNKSTAD